MSVDVDAVNERLNGLVTLLQAVGIDSGDVGALAKNLGRNESGNATAGARQLDDDQIEAIIRKLQQAQAEAPQIIAALEAHAEARSLGGSGKGEKRTGDTAPRQPTHSTEDQEEEEESEEEDDDANYPMVGHGISDDISVVSDLTTPTVVQGVNVPEEELYKETLPPMIVGGGAHAPPMMLNPSKRKNLVNTVRPPNQATARRPGPSPNPRQAPQNQPKRRPPPNVARGPPQTSAVRPSRNASIGSAGNVDKGNVDRANANKASGNGNRPAIGKKKVIKKKAPTGASNAPKQKQPAFQPNWGTDNGWNAFESGPRPKQKGSGSATVIDTDGFLVGEGGFDPFATQGNASTRSFSNTAGDLAFNDTVRSPTNGQNQAPRRRPPAKTKSKELLDEDREPTFSQLRTKNSNAPSGGRPKRSRRASLAM